MSMERHYVGRINDDGSRDLYRVGGEGDQLLPAFAWAGNGDVGWGSDHDPAQRAGELDSALAILVDATGDARRAFDWAERFADEVLAKVRPDGQLIVNDTDLRPAVAARAVFRADAAPIRDLLVATIADTGDPLDVVAAGYGLDISWTESIADGETTHLDLSEVKDLCARLYVTPHDLWRPEEARVIEGLWPASEWPVAQAIDTSAPMSRVGPDTEWSPAIEPAATLAVEAPIR